MILIGIDANAKIPSVDFPSLNDTTAENTEENKPKKLKNAPMELKINIIKNNVEYRDFGIRPTVIGGTCCG